MNIVFFGLGSIAKKHISALREIKESVSLFAVRHLEKASSKKNIKNISINEIKSLKVDAIILSNPSVYHSKLIKELAPLKIPLMVEKPVCISLEQWRSLNQLDDKKLPLIYIACNMRFHPLIKFLKKKVEDNPMKIYEINIYSGSYLPSWRKNIDYTKSYSSKSKMGGGVHLDLIHEIDYLIYLFGIPKEIRKQYRKVSKLNIDSNDYAHFLATYDNFSASITLNYYRRDPKRIFEIISENETIELDFIRGTVTDLKTQKVLLKIDSDGFKSSYLDQMSYFLDCAKKNQMPMNSLKESLNVIKEVL